MEEVYLPETILDNLEKQRQVFSKIDSEEKDKEKINEVEKKKVLLELSDFISLYKKRYEQIGEIYANDIMRREGVKDRWKNLSRQNNESILQRLQNFVNFMDASFAWVYDEERKKFTIQNIIRISSLIATSLILYVKPIREKILKAVRGISYNVLESFEEIIVHDFIPEPIKEKLSTLSNSIQNTIDKVGNEVFYIAETIINKVVNSFIDIDFLERTISYEKNPSWYESLQSKTIKYNVSSNDPLDEKQNKEESLRSFERILSTSEKIIARFSDNEDAIKGVKSLTGLEFEDGTIKFLGEEINKKEAVRIQQMGITDIRWLTSESILEAQEDMQKRELMSMRERISKLKTNDYIENESEIRFNKTQENITALLPLSKNVLTLMEGYKDFTFEGYFKKMHDTMFDILNKSIIRNFTFLYNRNLTNYGKSLIYNNFDRIFGESRVKKSVESIELLSEKIQKYDESIAIKLGETKIDSVSLSSGTFKNILINDNNIFKFDESFKSRLFETIENGDYDNISFDYGLYKVSAKKDEEGKSYRVVVESLTPGDVHSLVFKLSYFKFIDAYNTGDEIIKVKFDDERVFMWKDRKMIFDNYKTLKEKKIQKLKNLDEKSTKYINDISNTIIEILT